MTYSLYLITLVLFRWQIHSILLSSTVIIQIILMVQWQFPLHAHPLWHLSPFFLHPHALLHPFLQEHPFDFLTGLVVPRSMLTYFEKEICGVDTCNCDELPESSQRAPRAPRARRCSITMKMINGENLGTFQFGWSRWRRQIRVLITDLIGSQYNLSFCLKLQEGFKS
jgi:hypothetical protein